MKRTTGTEEALMAAAAAAKPMTRSDVTEMVVMARLKKGLSWAKIAKAIGQSKEWTTAALLGQMQMTKVQAEKAGNCWACRPTPCSCCRSFPTRARSRRRCPRTRSSTAGTRIVMIYGTTIKELIHEEFGDGIMSAIDFKMDISREPDPKGDRVKVMLSGKYLPYKTY